MLRASSLRFGLILAGCSAPEIPLSQPQPEPVPTPAPVVSSPSATSLATSEAEVTPPSPSAPEPAASPTSVERPAVCVGTGFVLDELFHSSTAALAPKSKLAGACDFEGDTTALESLGGPDAIETQMVVEPQPLAPGASAKVRVTFKNISPSPRSVLFRRPWDEPVLEIHARHPKGERADVVDTRIVCMVQADPPSERVVITLEPGGTATASGEYEARMMTNACIDEPAGVLRAGSYELEVVTPLRFLAGPDSRRSSPRSVAAPFAVGAKRR